MGEDGGAVAGQCWCHVDGNPRGNRSQRPRQGWVHPETHDAQPVAMLTAGSCPSVGRDARRGVDSIVLHSNQTTSPWLRLLDVDNTQMARSNPLIKAGNLRRGYGASAPIESYHV